MLKIDENSILDAKDAKDAKDANYVSIKNAEGKILDVDIRNLREQLKTLGIINGQFGLQRNEVLFSATEVLGEKNEKNPQLMRKKTLESVGLFAGGVAHEVNNLLMIISASLSLLQKGLDVDEQIKRIFKTVTRCGELTKQLISFIHAPDTQKSETKIQEIFEGVNQVLEIIIKKVEHTLINETLKQDLKLNVNVGQIQQVLINLYNNALQAIQDSKNHAQGKIITLIERKEFTNTMSGLKPGIYIGVSIHDNGKGIKPEDIAKFGKLGISSTKKNGNGFGLAVAEKYVQENGGCMLLQSEWGEGTKVTFYLPVDNYS